MWLGSALCGILSILENRFPPTPPTLKELASSAVEGNSCGEGNGTAGSSSGGLLGQGKGSSAGAVEAGSAADKERAGATSDGDNVGGIAGATTADGERLSGIGGSHRVADAAAVAAAVAAPQGAGHVLEEVRHQVAAEYLPVMADIRDQLIADLVGIEGSEVRRCRERGIGDGFVAGSMGSEVRGPVAGGRRGGGAFVGVVFETGFVFAGLYSGVEGEGHGWYSVGVVLRHRRVPLRLGRPPVPMVRAVSPELQASSTWGRTW